MILYIYNCGYNIVVEVILLNSGFYSDVGKRIRTQRELLNLTREKLSEQTGISIQFIADIERGRKGFTVETMKKLSDALFISADKIISDKDIPNDVQQITQLFETIDEKYIPLAVEHLKIFLKTISIK